MLKIKNNIKILVTLAIILMTICVFNANTVNAAIDMESIKNSDFDYIWVANQEDPKNELGYVGSSIDYDRSDLYITGVETKNNPSDLYVYIGSKANVGNTIKSNKGDFTYDGTYEMYSKTQHVYKLALSKVMDSSYANTGEFTFDFKSSNGLITSHKVSVITYGEKRETVKINGENSGISVNGVGISSIVAKEMQEDDSAYVEMLTQLTVSKDNLIISAYDIKIEGELEGELVLTFDVGTKNDGKKAYVYHRKQNGKYESFEETVINGRVSIVVTEFSPFMVAIEKTSQEIKDSNTDNKQLDNEPKTGMTDYIVLASVISLLSIAGLATLKFKKQ